jgi:hypothetical protein
MKLSGFGAWASRDDGDDELEACVPVTCGETAWVVRGARVKTRSKIFEGIWTFGQEAHGAVVGAART